MACSYRERLCQNACFLLFVSSQCFSFNNAWIVKIQGGVGYEQIEEGEYLADPEDANVGDNTSTLELVLSGARQFSSGAYVELGLRSSIENSILHSEGNGSYRRQEIFTFLGYALRNESKFKIIPKVGFSAWRLKANFENNNFNKLFSGVAPALGVDFSFYSGINKNLILGLTYAKYNFGKVLLASVGMGFNF